MSWEESDGTIRDDAGQGLENSFAPEYANGTGTSGEIATSVAVLDRPFDETQPIDTIADLTQQAKDIAAQPMPLFAKEPHVVIKPTDSDRAIAEKLRNRRRLDPATQARIHSATINLNRIIDNNEG